MPAPGARIHTALPARLRLYMLDHPGGHSAGDLARAVPPPEVMEPKKWSQKVANALVRMVAKGEVKRERNSEAAMGPGVTYRLPHEDHGSHRSYGDHDWEIHPGTPGECTVPTCNAPRPSEDRG